MVHRDDIQGLRAVAVLLVVLGHAGVPFLGGGYVGVDVFFVLSGFLITGLLLSQARSRGSISLVQFYGRRARRILPAAGLTLVVTTLAAYFLLNFVRARDTAVDSIWASCSPRTSISRAMEATISPRVSRPRLLSTSWSLAVEEQFYLVWPGCSRSPLVLALRRRGRPGLPTTADASPRCRRRRRRLARLVDSLHRNRPKRPPTTRPRARLGAGARRSACGRRRLGCEVSRSVAVALGWMGVAGIGAAGGVLRDNPFPVSAALLPAAATALVLAAGVVRSHDWESGACCRFPPLHYMGDRSYAFYLWHWPVLVIAAGYCWSRTLSGREPPAPRRCLRTFDAQLPILRNPIRRGPWTPLHRSSSRR